MNFLALAEGVEREAPVIDSIYPNPEPISTYISHARSVQLDAHCIQSRSDTFDKRDQYLDLALIS